MNAKWEREILNSSARAGALEDILYPSEFVEDQGGTFVTKRGHVVGVLRVSPAMYEVLDKPQLDLICARMQAALRGLDPAIRIYQYLIKTRVDSVAGRTYRANGALRQLAIHQQQYADRLLRPVYRLDAYWALVNESRVARDWWKWLYFPERGAAVIDGEVRAACWTLRMYLDGLVQALRGVIEAEAMGAEDTFQFLRRLMNYEDHPGLHLVEPANLDVQMSRTRVDARSTLMVGRSHVRVLTLEQPPARSAANLWSGFLSVPCQYIIASEWKPLSAARTQKLIHDLKLHFANQLRGIRSAISDATVTKNKVVHPAEMVVHGGKKGLVKDLEAAEEAISKKGLYFGRYGLTFVIHSEDLDELRAGVSGVMNCVHPHGAQISEGLGQAALASWLSIVPGHSRLNIRRLTLDNVSCANMSFLFGVSRGAQRNAFLGDEFLSLWFTQQRTPYYFNLHRGQVGHTLVTGASGSGKSYLLRSLILDSQKYDPYTVIFDVTHSFRGLTDLAGGSYLELGRREGPTATMNPFSLPATEENVSFLASLVRMLIQSDGGPVLNAEETEDIYAQVRSLMMTDLPAGHRRLGNLHPKTHLAPRLARWIRGGQHAWLFDNAEDSLSFAEFQTFSFPDLKGDREVLDALLFYVLHRTLQVIYETEQPSFVWIDEAINFLKNQTMRDYIFAALLNWRKQNASLILVLHSITDIPKDVAVPLAERCPTRLHLANPGIDPVAWQKILHLSHREAETIRALIPAKQVLVEGVGVMNLLAAPAVHEVLSTGMEKKEIA